MLPNIHDAINFRTVIVAFNHIIGLPKKNGEEKEFYDYQYSIYKALFIPSFVNFRPASP